MVVLLKLIGMMDDGGSEIGIRRSARELGGSFTHVGKIASFLHGDFGFTDRTSKRSTSSIGSLAFSLSLRIASTNLRFQHRDYA